MREPSITDPRTYQIIGAGMEVNRQLGTGFLEAVIANAFEVELSLRHIPFIREAAFPIHYKGHKLRGNYRADFLCFDEIIVEIKATTLNPKLDQAQMLNYLRASGLELGLLLNFSGPQMTWNRFIRSDKWLRVADQSENDATLRSEDREQQSADQNPTLDT